MNPVPATRVSCAENAVSAALFAVERILSAPDGPIGASTDARVQAALHHLRSERGADGRLAAFESLAASLHVLVEARRTGRPNLYASRLARLRRSHAAIADSIR